MLPSYLVAFRTTIFSTQNIYSGFLRFQDEVAHVSFVRHEEECACYLSNGSGSHGMQQTATFTMGVCYLIVSWFYFIFIMASGIKAQKGQSFH